MQKLSRLGLFEWILSDEGRGVVREAMGHLWEGYEREFIETIRLNYRILTGVESYFVAEQISQNSEIPLEELNNICSDNIDKEGLDKVSFLGEISNSKDSYYVFNKLLNFLNKESDVRLRKFYRALTSGGNELTNGEGLNQVFLSYAYEDRLYTLCLYFYMLYHGVKLYVDWLFCPKLPNGEDIKKNLSIELEKSVQFLFLRSVNSELKIRGGNTIRGWCSWELGRFYNLNSKESSNKYYLELYSRSDSKKALKGSLQLDGLRKLVDVRHGQLRG